MRMGDFGELLAPVQGLPLKLPPQVTMRRSSSVLVPSTRHSDYLLYESNQFSMSATGSETMTKG